MTTEIEGAIILSWSLRDLKQKDAYMLMLPKRAVRISPLIQSINLLKLKLKPEEEENKAVIDTSTLGHRS